MNTSTTVCRLTAKKRLSHTVWDFSLRNDRFILITSKASRSPKFFLKILFSVTIWLFHSCRSKKDVEETMEPGRLLRKAVAKEGTQDPAATGERSAAWCRAAASRALSRVWARERSLRPKASCVSPGEAWEVQPTPLMWNLNLCCSCVPALQQINNV